LKSGRLTPAVLAGFALLSSNANAAGPDLVANGSFETGGPLIHAFGTIPGPGSNVPEGLKGGWGHNDGTVFVGADPGITPVDAIRVLKFETTGYPGPDFPAPNGNWKTTVFTGTSSDICQLVDLSDHSLAIAEGNAVLSASVWVNRIGTTDNLYRLSLWPFFGPFSDLTDSANAPNWDELTYGDLYSDSDPNTWEEVTLDIVLPPNTTFVRLGISAVENVSQQTAYPELEGHYADLVSAHVSVAPPVPIPMPVPLMVASLLGLFGCLTLRRAG